MSERVSSITNSSLNRSVAKKAKTPNKLDLQIKSLKTKK